MPSLWLYVELYSIFSITISYTLAATNNHNIVIIVIKKTLNSSKFFLINYDQKPLWK